MDHDTFIKGILQNSRDNGRTPMHWNSSVNAGFNEGAKPWLFINENYPEINAEDELKDPNSVLNYYKNLISLRKGEYKDLLIYGTYERLTQLELTENMFVYQMEYEGKKVMALINLGEEEIDLSSLNLKYDNIIVKNYQELENKLRPYEAFVLGGSKNE